MSNLLPQKTSSSGNISGLVCGVLAPTSFGFIPFFTIPLINAGMNTASILAYRFLFSALILLLVMLVRKIPLKMNRHHLLVVLLLGAIYVWSAAGLQIGYRYMPTGICTVVHFTYPIWVILIMLLLYKQRPAPITLAAIAMAIIGVACLVGLFGTSQKIPLAGFIIVASTGIAYATYLVIVSKSGINQEHPVKVSFYVMTTTGILFSIIALSTGGINTIPGPSGWVNTILLCIVSTVLSNILLVVALKNAGATTNSILGSLEPLTAVSIGVVFLSETLTISSLIGVGLIIIAVLLIALSGRLAYLWKVHLLRRRHRH